MSLAQKINELKPYVDPEGGDLLEEIGDMLVKHDPDHCAEAVSAALEEDEIDFEELRGLFDTLESSLARHFQPRPDQYTAYKSDMKRFFGLIDQFLDCGRLDGVRDIFSYYPFLFAPGGKKKCGSLLRKCRDCKTRFPEASIFCPECDSPRSLCRQPAGPHGRCMRVGIHGGNRNGQMSIVGRGKAYAKTLGGRLQDAYIEAITDENYLSVAPEIAALAARNQEVMSQLGDTDYVVVQSSIRRAVRNMRQAIKEENDWRVYEEAQGIIEHLETVNEDRRRWDEIVATSGRLGRLVETERKRITDQQQMITVQQMYQLQQETLLQIRDSATIIAQQLYARVSEGMEVSPTEIRRLILKTMSGVMDGRIKVDDYMIREADPGLLPDVIEAGD